MSLTTEILNKLKCCLNQRDHLLRNPLNLKCGHCACKCCIERKNGLEFQCNFPGCEKTYKIKRLDKLQPNHEIQLLMEKYKNELREHVKDEFNKIFLNLQSLSVEEVIDTNCDLIELEIEIKIESLKNELETLSDSMRKKVNSFREQMKCLIPQKEIDSTNEFLNDMQKIFLDSTQGGNLLEFEDNLKKCKKRMEFLSGCIPKLPFTTSELEISEMYIGNLGDIIYNPLKEEDEIKNLISQEPCRFENLTNKTPAYPPFSSMSRLIYRYEKDDLVVCDTANKSIKLIDSVNQSYITQTNPDKLLDCPVSICASSNGDVYIGDYTHEKIFVYDECFDFIRTFGDGVIQKPFYMIIDQENDYLYVSEKRNNVISVWNTNTNLNVCNIECDSPAHSKIINDKLFVVSGIDYELFKGKMILKRLIKGQNCIYVYNKTTYELDNIIKLNNWFDLRGLCVDEYSNIYTSAHEITKNAKSTISETAYIYKLDLNGQLLRKYSLDTTHVRDMILFENKVVIVRGNNFPYIITFTFE